jgi:hypothetical protein
LLLIVSTLHDVHRVTWNAKSSCSWHRPDDVAGVACWLTLKLLKIRKKRGQSPITGSDPFFTEVSVFP